MSRTSRLEWELQNVPETGPWLRRPSFPGVFHIGRKGIVLWTRGILSGYDHLMWCRTWRRKRQTTFKARFIRDWQPDLRKKQVTGCYTSRHRHTHFSNMDRLRAKIIGKKVTLYSYWEHCDPHFDGGIWMRRRLIDNDHFGAWESNLKFLEYTLLLSLPQLYHELNGDNEDSTLYWT